MLNKFITGSILANLIEQYVEAINKGAAPNVSSAWESVLKSEINSSFDRAKLYLRDAFKDLQYPMETAQMYLQVDVKLAH